MFGKIFKKNDSTPQESLIYKELRPILSHLSHEEVHKVSHIMGLIAEVAFADMVYGEKEIVYIKEYIVSEFKLNTELCDQMISISLKAFKESVSLEEQYYTIALRDILSEREKYYLVLTLFKLAASDGGVEQVEAEEIRNICKGLLLEHKHFLAARAEVLEFLNALKKY